MSTISDLQSTLVDVSNVYAFMLRRLQMTEAEAIAACEKEAASNERTTNHKRKRKVEKKHEQQIDPTDGIDHSCHCHCH